MVESVEPNRVRLLVGLGLTHNLIWVSTDGAADPDELCWIEATLPKLKFRDKCLSLSDSGAQICLC